MSFFLVFLLGSTLFYCLCISTVLMAIDNWDTTIASTWCKKEESFNKYKNQTSLQNYTSFVIWQNISTTKFGPEMKISHSET